MSLNLTKSGNVLVKILPVKKTHLEQKSQKITIMRVKENLECRRKKVPVAPVPFF